MSAGKSYNRIVFLTTLSVYLGLVLVGGTAPVLAHSALTKQFDVRNEIEFKDDLDNKPDNEEIKDDFPSLFAQLLDEIKKSTGSGKISLPLQRDFRFEASFSLAEMCSGSAFGSEANTDKFLSKIVSDNFSEKFIPKSLDLADYPRVTAKNVKISFEANQVDLSLKISFGKINAAQFADFLNNQFSNSAKTAENSLLKKIYENTNSSSENNQVFIVTHLPRAAIDEFLAKTDAQ